MFVIFFCFVLVFHDHNQLYSGISDLIHASPAALTLTLSSLAAPVALAAYQSQSNPRRNLS